MSSVYPYSYSIASHIRKPARPADPARPMLHTKAARSHLGQKAAQAIDVELMTTHGFTIEQLMELAGLSVADSIAAEYARGRVLLCIGPGNNGGDGLVAARHLTHYGYRVSLFYPKQPQKDLYKSLLRQCGAFQIPV
ncbi:hypothetical protein IWQ56_005550, partial [Coemansia nantahalensis]